MCLTPPITAYYPGVTPVFARISRRVLCRLRSGPLPLAGWLPLWREAEAPQHLELEVGEDLLLDQLDVRDIGADVEVEAGQPAQQRGGVGERLAVAEQGRVHQIPAAHRTAQIQPLGEPGGQLVARSGRPGQGDDSRVVGHHVAVTQPAAG